MKRPAAPTVFRLSGLLTLLIAGGCQAPGSPGKLTEAVTDYHAGRYLLASRRATEAGRQAGWRLKAEAAYVAGLSAYRLGDVEEARVQFDLAAGSADPQTAGRAKAMLGLLLTDEGQPEEAAELFKAAAGALRDEDARQAAHHAALAYEQAGDPVAAETWAAFWADFARRDRASRHRTGLGGPAGAGFVLQVGAFRDRDRARRAAGDAAVLARRHGHGPVRIVPGAEARGRPLHLVQFGRFPTRSSAANARAQLGRLQYIVVRANGGES